MLIKDFSAASPTTELVEQVVSELSGTALVVTVTFTAEVAAAALTSFSSSVQDAVQESIRVECVPAGATTLVRFSKKLTRVK